MNRLKLFFLVTGGARGAHIITPSCQLVIASAAKQPSPSDAAEPDLAGTLTSSIVILSTPLLLFSLDCFAALAKTIVVGGDMSEQ